MGFEEDALKLFLTENIAKAEEITMILNKYNKERQEIEKRIYEEAINKIKTGNLQNNSAIVVGSENWHHGVIGIVASKITDMFFKPSILICFEDDEGNGSGRSIPGFDLHEALCKSSEYLIKYGGHEMAVGLSLKKSNFAKFAEEFERIAKEAQTDEIVSVVKIDKELTQKDLRIETIQELKLLEPFGEGNKMPTFIYKNLKIDSIRALTEGKHLKLTLKYDNIVINAIGFNMGNLADEYLIGDKVDVLGALEINTYNGNSSIQLNLKDIRKSYE